jgi:hypothetical protein
MQAPNDLVSVYSTNNAGEAEILRAALQGEGIKCEIDGENQAGLAGIISMESNCWFVPKILTALASTWKSIITNTDAIQLVRAMK